MEFIIKYRSGDYVGEEGTVNSVRSYAKRFPSQEEAQAAADRIQAFVEVEPYQSATHSYRGAND